MQPKWKVTIFTSKEKDAAPQVFFDESLVKLRNQVEAWLLKEKPEYLSCGEHNPLLKKEIEPGKIGYAYPDSLSPQKPANALHIFCLHMTTHIEPGPDYQEEGMINGVFQLPAVRKIMNIGDEAAVNKMFRRGWRLIAIEKRGNEYHDDSAVYYVLGHTEPDAF